MKIVLVLLLCATMGALLNGDPQEPRVFPIEDELMPASSAYVHPLRQAEAPADEPGSTEENPTVNLPVITAQRSEELLEALPSILSQVREERRYIIAKSSIATLTQADIQSLTPLELTRAWQEIYARHGKAEDSWFESRPWFSPRGNFRERDLSSIERKNITMLKKAAEREQSHFAPLSKSIGRNGTVQTDLDLDGNGQKEQITIGYNKSTGEITLLCNLISANLPGLSADGLVYSVYWIEGDSYPILLVPLLVDMKMVTYHFRYANQQFLHMGTTEGGIDSLKWIGNGTFLSQKTATYPCEYTYAVYYRVTDTGIEEIPDTLTKMNVPVTMKTALTVTREPGGTRPITFNAGEDATLVAVSTDGWYALLAEDDLSLGWFHVDMETEKIAENDRSMESTFKWLPK